MQRQDYPFPATTSETTQLGFSSRKALQPEPREPLQLQLGRETHTCQYICVFSFLGSLCCCSLFFSTTSHRHDISRKRRIPLLIRSTEHGCKLQPAIARPSHLWSPASHIFQDRWLSFKFWSSWVTEIFYPAQSCNTVVVTRNIASAIETPVEHDVELVGVTFVCHRPPLWRPSIRVKHTSHLIVIERPCDLNSRQCVSNRFPFLCDTACQEQSTAGMCSASPPSKARCIYLPWLIYGLIVGIRVFEPVSGLIGRTIKQRGKQSNTPRHSEQLNY